MKTLVDIGSIGGILRQFFFFDKPPACGLVFCWELAGRLFPLPLIRIFPFFD